jgi:hypothetical protein
MNSLCTPCSVVALWEAGAEGALDVVEGAAAAASPAPPGVAPSGAAPPGYPGCLLSAAKNSPMGTR